jgi:hypothetical protein
MTLKEAEKCETERDAKQNIIAAFEKYLHYCAIPELEAILPEEKV